MTRRSWGAAISLCVLATAAVLTAGEEPAPWFEEVSAAAGIDFVHVRGGEIRHWFPEIMSGGAGWCDYDGDGDLDLYLVQGGDLDPRTPNRPGNRMYRNLGDGTFADVTTETRLGDTGYGMGVACGDYDGDGDLDLYVTNVGANALYRNDGERGFTDTTAQTGTGDAGWGASAAFVDYDGDGDLDLFVVNYVDWSPEREIVCSSGARRRDYCQPENYNAPGRDTLYRNDGERGFTDVTSESGISSAYGDGLGVLAEDLDLDGRPDLYVANDGDPNQLWINQGGGRFQDRALLSGAAVNMIGQAEAGMGVAAGDVDGDGALDLFMTHLRGETNTLYVNRDGFFEDVSATAGVAAAGVAYTGFGTALADFDHDGELDVYVANGRVGQTLAPLVEDDPFAEPNQLFRGLGSGRFDEVMPRGGTASELVGNSRAAAFGDYDNDGDIDVAVVENGGRARLLRNLAGERGRWVTFRVVGVDGGDALGARVGARAGGRTRWRTVTSAYSYCASNDPRAHFGLGEAAVVEEVRVLWPGGGTESFGPFETGKLHELRRGSGRRPSTD